MYRAYQKESANLKNLKFKFNLKLESSNLK